MQSNARIALITFATLIALAAGASSAMALRSLSLAPTEGELGNVRADGTLTISGESFMVTCAFRRRIALRSTVAKRAGAELGEVTLIQAECRGASFRVLGPEAGRIPISYISFSGTLPNITAVGIEIRGFAFLVETETIRCLYRGNVRATMAGNPSGETRLDESVSIPLFTNLGVLPCPSRATIRGTLTVVRPTIAITLI